MASERRLLWRTRQGEAKTTAVLVLAGLKGRAVAERCPAQQTTQSLPDPRRDQFLAPAAPGFDAPQRPRTEARLAQNQTRLKPLVGALTCEGNPSDARLA